MSERLVSLALVCLVLLPGVLGATGDDRLQPLTLEAIFSPDDAVRVEFGGSPLTGLTWMQDGRAFLRPAGDGEVFQPPLRVDIDSGEARPLFEADQMVSALARLPDFASAEAPRLSAEDVRLGPAQDALVATHAENLFYYRLGSARAFQLTDDDRKEELAELSPDGRFAAYIRDGDLYVVTVDDQEERRLTDRDGKDLLFGKLDWVYQEELYGRGNFKGYWWSPDSRRIAFLGLDETPVHDVTLVDHLTSRLETEVLSYPKAGDPNPRVALGVVSVPSGEIQWVDTSRYGRKDYLIVRVAWTPNAQRVVFLLQDREQTWLDINLADPETGAIETLVHETSPAFIDVDLTGAPHWLRDGSFLWLSGRTGYHHLYHFDPDGSLRRQLTTGDWEVRELYGADETRGWIYLAASEHSPIEDHLYRVRLDGSGWRRLSQRPGSHQASFDPTFSHYLDTWSDVRTPPKVFLHRADGSERRVVDANTVAALDDYALGDVEFLQVSTPDGFEMEAALIRPPDFDPSRRYPVVQYTYGGPHAPVVRNAWAGRRQMWLHLLAQEGIVVWLCDNRSASGKGVRPVWAAYQRLGEMELRDIEAGLAWLKGQPWVDDQRLGIYGWSYGGFMAAYALTHSRSFKAGIAGAPVTDWRLYDTIYTERYMRRPQNNPDGYDATSVVKAAGDLHGRLLLIHGTMDDNVHLQNSIQLVKALQKAGKDFDLMLYPSSRHGIRDAAQTYHLYRLMTRFLKENL